MSSRGPLLLAITITIVVALLMVLNGTPWTQVFPLRPHNSGGSVMVMMSPQTVEAVEPGNARGSARDVGRGIAGAALGKAAELLGKALMDGSLKEGAKAAGRAYVGVVQRGVEAIEHWGRLFW